ncbi:MAG: hypothetical protein P8J86_08385 [Phycisphaerales bacterium]|nr:hypothetical protein [Phycisphaerales bacterium]
MITRKSTGLFILTLSAALAVGLTGCGKGKGTGGSTPPPGTTTSPNGGSASSGGTPTRNPNAAPVAPVGTSSNANTQSPPPGMTGGAGRGN